MKALALDLFSYDCNDSTLKRGLGQVLSFMSILFTLTFISYFLLAGSGAPYRMKVAEVGPSQLKINPSESYQFGQLPNEYGSIDFSKVDQLSKKEVHQLILTGMPTKLRNRFRHFLPATLTFSEQYKVDPLWVIAIMWTESHFDVNASSRVNAKGLMQIMPKTGAFLSRKLKRGVPPNVSRKLIEDPILNIELGVFYLKNLLVRFNQNYKLATIAYNMGPGWVKKRLNNGGPIGVKNNYYNKVNRAYISLAGQVEGQLMFLPRPYRKTFVVREPLIPGRNPGLFSIEDEFARSLNVFSKKPFETALF